MAIRCSGEFTTLRGPQEVYDFLSDPHKFGPLLPDFQSMTLQDPTHFTVRVKVGVSHIRGIAEIKMELSEAVAAQRALYKGQGNAVGSEITLLAGFDLFPAEESTRVEWHGEANVYGKLASMAGGMLEPMARKNIQKLIDAMKIALGETAAGAAKAVAPFSSKATADLDPRPMPNECAVSNQNAQAKSEEASGAGPDSPTAEQQP